MNNTASPGIIDSFKQKARVWAQKVVDLHNLPVPNDMLEQKQKMIDSAETIKKWIEGIFGTIDGFNQAGLGILPLVPIAVIATALAAITKWSISYATFVATVKERKRLEASGLSPQMAAELARKNQDSALIKIDWKAALPFALVLGTFLFFNR